MTSINLRYVVRLLGLLLLLMSGAMVLALLWSTYEFWFRVSSWREGPEVIFALLGSMGIGAVFGGGLYWWGSTDGHFGKKEALLLVSLSWFGGALLAALPFFFWAQAHTFLPGQDLGFLSFVNCYFEAMSGLTTTGATVLSKIETIPRGILFWRAFTHWLGGLGIVVIFVAVLPSLGGSSKKLFRFESTGITSDGATPNIKETTRILLGIYIVFTIAETLAIKIVDPSVSWFSSLTHTFATLATGGYSVLNASAGGLSPGVQWVIIFFMVLAGVNFGLYHKIVRGKLKEAIKDTEFRVYIRILLIGFAIIAFCIHGTNYNDTTGELAAKSVTTTIRDAAFQTVSIQTTTGFASVNFEEWGLVPKAVLIALMFIGGCGGSTGGGIKVIRILGALKIMWVELERAFRPSVLRPVRIGTHNVEYHQRISILAYVLGILVLFGIGSVLLMFTENIHWISGGGPGISGTTALTASIASLNNIGPGFAAVGAIENYAWFSSCGKMILCFLMAIGRLEVFAVLVVFMPGFWRSH